MTIKQMLEIRQERTKEIKEKTDVIVGHALSEKPNVELVKELQTDIRVLNGQVDLLDLVMGLK